MQQPWPGREHDTACARRHGLVDALNRSAAALDLPTLVDLGYENAGGGFRRPAKKPAGGELTEAQLTYNKVVRNIHGACARANSLLETTFKALRRVGLDPAASRRSPPRSSSYANWSMTSPSEQSRDVVIRYWQRFSVILWYINGSLTFGD